MSRVEPFVFGAAPDGRAVDGFALKNAGRAEAVVIAYGASLTSLRVPDPLGRLGQVVLGFDTLAPHLGDHPFFGATVGSFANRIARGRLSLDGRPVTLRPTTVRVADPSTCAMVALGTCSATSSRAAAAPGVEPITTSCRVGHLQFPSIRLDHGQVYAHSVSYRFETDRTSESL